MTRVGLIADTHGLLRPEAVSFLRGCDHILHAGDIGDPAILAALSALAPLTAVRGNNDRGDWASMLPLVARIEIEQVTLVLVHERPHFDRAAYQAPIHAVISGHSHRPRIDHVEGLVYVNPGSAGPRRFKLPIAVGELEITGTTLIARTAVLAAT